MVQGEDKLKGSAQANSNNDRLFNIGVAPPVSSTQWTGAAAQCREISPDYHNQHAQKPLGMVTNSAIAQPSNHRSSVVVFKQASVDASDLPPTAASSPSHCSQEMVEGVLASAQALATRVWVPNEVVVGGWFPGDFIKREVRGICRFSDFDGNGLLVWLDAAFDCATAERDHNAIRPRTDEKMTSEIHPHWDADPCYIKTLKG